MEKIQYSSTYGEIKNNKSFTFKVNDINFIIRKHDFLIVKNEMRYIDFVIVEEIFNSLYGDKILIEVNSIYFKDKYIISFDKVIGKVNVVNDKYLLNKLEVIENE